MATLLLNSLIGDQMDQLGMRRLGLDRLVENAVYNENLSDEILQPRQSDISPSFSICFVMIFWETCHLLTRI